MSARCLLLTFLCLPSTALAQPHFDEYGSPRPLYQPVPPWPVEMGFSQDHSSTASESHARGQAAIIQANGNYLLSEMQAAILAEQVRGSCVANDCLKREYRLWKNSQRQARLEAIRQKNIAARVEKLRNAFALKSDQLTRDTGTILWPSELQTSRYRELRQQLEELFRQIRDGGLATVDSSSIELVTQRLIRELQSDRGEIPQRDYLAAQKFLRGLKYEPLFRSQVN